MNNIETKVKQVVILSGKGGTGKTSVAAAFAHLAAKDLNHLRVVLADTDVDAANLELVLRPERLETNDFMGGSVAVIDGYKCQGCGICEQVCRFEAVIAPENGTGQHAYLIDPTACDGCAACVYQCPEQAIHMQPQMAGRWYYSESRYGPFFHADLFPAQENSGKLVTLVKQNARLHALDNGFSGIIVDGPPGIGCPVIAAAAGADAALIVTEPTVSGIHDLERILETTSYFHIPAFVVINKADIYPQGTQDIATYCAKLDIKVIGHIPFDPIVTEAMRNGEPITAYQETAPASRALRTVWQLIKAELMLSGGSYA